MEENKNLYQITKTIRFGLTLKKSAKKNPTHQILFDCVKHSQKEVELKSKKNSEKTEKVIIENVQDCLCQIIEYLKKWERIYDRADQISLTRDYYKIIAKKAKFDIKKTDKGESKPKSQFIKISSLKDIYFDKSRKDYIEQYWRENLATTQQLCDEFKPFLEQYKTALSNNDKAHTKPHLIDFRKMFLSICNRVCDTLVPMVNNSIVFPYIDKLSDEERNEAIKEFSSLQQCGERQNLLKLIEEIREYFQCNGGNVPFGRVTLNKYTAEQKPNNYKEEIKKIIKDLQLYEFIKILQNENNISDYFQKQEKLSVLQDENKSIIECVQMFKCKPIPASVRIVLSDFLQKEYNVTDALSIIESIGTQVSPAYDYSKNTKEEDKNNFDLDKYPIKLAFDYAWENLARSQYHVVDFPKEKCEIFLKNKFDVDTDNENFKLYAGLLCITENIATLEYNEPNNREKIISEIKEMIEELSPNKKSDELQKAKNLQKEIKNLEKEKSKEEKKRIKKENEAKYQEFEQIKYLITMEKYFPKIKKAIDDYLNKSKPERERIRKEKTDETYLAFLKAKQEIGLVRGGQKNKIKKYYKLTQTFKDLASKFGSIFGELRDKFREENEINKISYCGIIIEDKNCDRYVLLQPINDKNDKAKSNDTKIYEIQNGDLITYQVKSLTSKTLNKIIKNSGRYKDFHYNCKLVSSINKNNENNYIFDKRFNKDNAQKKWKIYQNDENFISYLKDCLIKSTMSKNQNWVEFGWNFSNCKKYDEISKEVDKKSYILQKGKISIKNITDLIKNNNCLLLPIVNQDITSKTRVLKNQFSKDWQMIFDDSIKEYRLHPEFNIIYRRPTPDYPNPGEKRYSRFQMIGGFQCEIFPQETDFISKREQINIFNDKEKQKQNVENFNECINSKIGNDYYVIGIDRGIKQLATLCVLNNKGEIQGNFEIYTRQFDKEKKEWKHSLLKKGNILDLSNLRVETTVDGKKVLVDLSSIKTKDKNKEYTKENLQTVKLKQLSYIRKLQYQMQYNEETVLAFFKKYPTQADIEKNIGELISKYKEGESYADLPTDKIKDMLELFCNYCKNNQEDDKRKLCELDAADNLKSGIVANMVGVISYLIEKYNYKAFVSLENLCRAFYPAIDGITRQEILSSHQDPAVDFKEQENLVLAGVGTYQFFEMQLLKKLFKMQRDEKIINLVPAFRSVANYEQIVKRNKSDKDEYINYPFGIVQFVDPKNTSKKCPWCDETTKFSRNNGKDKNSIKCNNCGFSTIENNEQQSNNYNERKNLNLDFIKNGDQNGAYHIALKTLRNIQTRIKQNN